MIVGIILFISIIFDGLLSNYLSYMVGNLSIFTPLFTLMSIFIIYRFFKKRDIVKYFILIGAMGFIYDLLYTNLLFFNMIVFLIVGLLVVCMYKYLDVNFVMIVIEAIILIICYEGIVVLLLISFNIVNISFSDFFLRLGHCFIANIIYVELVYMVINLLPKRYREPAIN